MKVLKQNITNFVMIKIAVDILKNLFYAMINLHKKNL